MTPDSVGPLSRPFPLHRATPAGVDAVVDTTEAERAALAADLGLAGLARLEGRYRVSGGHDRVRVEGRVLADLQQVCVVTLDPLPVEIDETVLVEFAAPAGDLPDEFEIPVDHDPPDALSGDTIDLGAITAEFLALALDPYPRKPGVSFEAPPESESASPFAGLSALRRDDP